LTLFPTRLAGQAPRLLGDPLNRLDVLVDGRSWYELFLISFITRLILYSFVSLSLTPSAIVVVCFLSGLDQWQGTRERRSRSPTSGRGPPPGSLDDVCQLAFQETKYTVLRIPSSSYVAARVPNNNFNLRFIICLALIALPVPLPRGVLAADPGHCAEE
jgi:hypothetical protein